MSAEQVAVLAFMLTAVFVLLAGGVAIALMLFVWMRAFVKFANVHLVFKQADAFGREMARRLVPQRNQRGLPTRPQMVDIDDEVLRGAAGYTEPEDDDDDEGDPSSDGAVHTMDEHAGYDPTEPPVGSKSTVGGRVP